MKKPESAISVQLSVYREHWLANTVLQPHREASCPYCHQAIWHHSGECSVNNKKLEAGTGLYVASDDVISITDQPVQALRFVFCVCAKSSCGTVNVNDQQLAQRTLVATHTFKTLQRSAVLRLDQVDFPPAAVAYKHTHPGPGIRYLVSGALQLESDHGVQDVSRGEAWFEDANSPVQATATKHEKSSFVRLLLLPVEYAGQTTLTLVNPEDVNKPRLQSNTRYFDKEISLAS